MKITQRMIDQAAMIASAKVGQQLQEFCMGGWLDMSHGVVSLDDGNFAYRLKPEPPNDGEVMK
jgi:hypothetical protein